MAFFLISSIIRLINDMCLALWSTNYLNKEPIYYIQLYLIFIALTWITAYVRGYAFAILVRSSSVRIFKNMLHSLLRTPLWWYDITPMGRILNRCTKD